MEAARFSSQDVAALIAHQLAGHAFKALVDEATLAPKPGLVDSRGSGSHSDLSLELMCRSAHALRPAFFEMALVAHGHATSLSLRESLGAIGRSGEQAMMQATGGVNTHRGAIWALGLLIAAAAQDPMDTIPAKVAARAAAIAQLPDRHLPDTPRKGAIACRTYGVGGARAEAQNGFPHVIEHALPALYATRAKGYGETSARLDALLAIMSRLDDTCVLSRGGRAALQDTQAGAQAVLAAGGVGSFDGRRRLHELELAMKRHNASPGGAADLLAATLLLDRLAPTNQERSHGNSAT
jgi:triphosphoribosyl-dephospho-CoA synthase